MSQVFPAMMAFKEEQDCLNLKPFSSFLFLDFGSLELFQPSLELKKSS